MSDLCEIQPTRKPHRERDGCHYDRYELWLDGDLITVSRQPWYAGARELLKRGYSLDMLMRMYPDAKAYPLSWWAQWTVEDSDRGGLRRRLWQPFKVPQESGAG